MRTKIIILLALFSFASKSQYIYNVAGSGLIGSGGDGGPAINASMDQPYGVAVDGSGNVYFTDATMGCVRKVDASGIITTIAGTPGFNGYSGDGGPATSALLNFPIGIVVDATGNVYIADNGKIRQINTSGIISTFAGAGTSTLDGVSASTSLFTSVTALAIDASGNIYLNDVNRIRKINTSGIINTIAGTGVLGHNGDGGPATSAQIYGPGTIAVDNLGNLYFGEDSKYCVRKVNGSGIISTVVGVFNSSGYSGDGGPATSAQLNSVYGLAADALGNIYISDSFRTMRKINSSGIISTFSGTIVVGGYNGTGIPATSATINYPQHITTDGLGNVYFCDRDNHRVRVICVASCLAGINEVENHVGLVLYPNPVSNTLWITTEQAIFENSEIEITNCLGQIVLKLPYKNEVDVSNLASGCYVLKITASDKKSYHHKFIKE